MYFVCHQCVCVCVCVPRARVCVHPSVKVSLLKFPSYTILSVLSLSPMQLPDKHGITALLAAVYEDHADCVKVLVNSVSRSYHCSTPPPPTPLHVQSLCVYSCSFPMTNYCGYTGGVPFITFVENMRTRLWICYYIVQWVW